VDREELCRRAATVLLPSLLGQFVRNPHVEALRRWTAAEVSHPRLGEWEIRPGLPWLIRALDPSFPQVGLPICLTLLRRACAGPIVHLLPYGALEGPSAEELALPLSVWRPAMRGGGFADLLPLDRAALVVVANLAKSWIPPRAGTPITKAFVADNTTTTLKKLKAWSKAAGVPVVAFWVGSDPDLKVKNIGYFLTGLVAEGRLLLTDLAGGEQALTAE
jgi:hypothetical protein